MNKIEQSIEIGVPVEDFYALITDFENYPNFLSDVKASRLLNRNDEVYEVEFTVQVIRRLNYVLRLEGTPHTGLKWSYLSGQLFKKNDGGWALENVGAGTRATYWVDVEITRFVPKAISNKLTQISLPNMLGQWKRHAEQLYRANASQS
jgi:coenzyme Q-binding protein COQ10